MVVVQVIVVRVVVVRVVCCRVSRFICSRRSRFYVEFMVRSEFAVLVNFELSWVPSSTLFCEALDCGSLFHVEVPLFVGQDRVVSFKLGVLSVLVDGLWYVVGVSRPVLILLFWFYKCNSHLFF